jgi:putative salt-induced outer membrane protein
VALKERLVLFPNVSDVGQFRGALDTSLLTRLSNWLGWQITLSDRYLSNPLPGIKKNDLLLTTGLRLAFGRERLSK